MRYHLPLLRDITYTSRDQMYQWKEMFSVFRLNLDALNLDVKKYYSDTTGEFMDKRVNNPLDERLSFNLFQLNQSHQQYHS